MHARIDDGALGIELPSGSEVRGMGKMGRDLCMQVRGAGNTWGVGRLSDAGGVVGGAGASEWE